MKRVLLGILLFTCPTHAQKTNWVELISQGQDKKAAAELLRFIEQMPSDSDPDLLYYLKETAYSLDVGMDTCSEEEKIIIFRGTQFDRDRRDVLYGGSEHTMIAAKALRNSQWELSPYKLRALSKKSFLKVIMNHSENTFHSKNTPLISASFDPGVPYGGPEKAILIIKLDPRRLAFMASAHTYEYETLIPFFVHPRELMAIVQTDAVARANSHNRISSGDFVVISAYNDLKQKRPNEAKKVIQNWAQRNVRALSRTRQSFSEFIGIKAKAAERKSQPRPLEKWASDKNKKEANSILSDPKKLKKALTLTESMNINEYGIALNEGYALLMDLASHPPQNSEIYFIVADIAKNARDKYPRHWQTVAEAIIKKINSNKSHAQRCNSLLKVRSIN